MELKDLKYKVENNLTSDDPIVFKISDNSFLPYQYINKIISDKKLNFICIDSLDEISDNGMFDFDVPAYIYVCDKLDDFKYTKNLFIITKKITCDCEDYYVDIPKLEQWQIKDYVYSNCTDVDRNKLDNLLDICNYDIFRLDKEISKLNIFDKSERNFLFNKFDNDGIFDDLSKYTVFNFTNAIVKKDIQELYRIYLEKDSANIDIEPLGVITILQRNFKNIIDIQLAKNPTAESCGMSSKQFWAVRNNCGIWTADQLIKIYKELNSIDFKLKTGKITNDLILDYIICFIFSC